MERDSLVELRRPSPAWGAGALVSAVLALVMRLADWARKHGKQKDHASLVDDPELHKALGAAVDRVNKSMSMLEKVRRFTMADEPFSTENGMMTPTLKIKRHVIKQHYGETLEGLYHK